MREIKFRAWTGKKTGMTKPFTLEEVDENEVGVEGNADPKHFSNYLLAENVIMQYTGLKSKNREIYEGDLLKDKAGHIWEVKYKAPRFYLECNGHKNDFDPALMEVCELVGNIYENAELLTTE